MVEYTKGRLEYTNIALFWSAGLLIRLVEAIVLAT